MVAILESYMRDRFKVSNERLKHCESCEHFEKRTSRCDKCGCFMNFKTLIPGSSCPLGKWEKIEISDSENKNLPS